MIDGLKVFILGFFVYISNGLFFYVGSMFFDELKDKGPFELQARKVKNNFWKSCIEVSIFLVAIISVAVFYFDVILTEKIVLRCLAVFVALVATLGRGGFSIQSYTGETIIERIDAGMYKISQFSATFILLFILIMN